MKRVSTGSRIMVIPFPLSARSNKLQLGRHDARDSKDLYQPPVAQVP